MERSAVRGIFRKVLRGMMKTVIALVLLAAALLAWIAYLNYPPRYPITLPAMPARNGYDDFLRASNARRHINELVAVQVDWREAKARALDQKRLEERKQDSIKYNYHDEVLESIQTPLSLEALLKENEAALVIIREGLQYPCVMPLDPNRTAEENERRVRESSLASTNCRHLLEVNALFRLSVTDRRAAAEALIDLIHFSSLTIPWYESQREMGYAQLQALADDLTTEELRDVVSRLETIRRCRTSYASVLELIRCNTLYGLSAYLADARYVRWYSSRVAVGIPVMHPSPLEDRPMHVNQFYAWTVPNWKVPAIADRYLKECIRAATKPFADHAAFPSIPQDAINWSHFGWAEWDREYLQWVMWEFQQDSLMLTLAIHGFYQEHGLYPAKLEDLISKGWLQELPIDPFTMRDTICYQNHGGSFTLYSRGPDGDDDGGRPVSKRVKQGRHDTDQFLAYQKYLLHVDSEGDVVYGVHKNVISSVGRL